MDTPLVRRTWYGCYVAGLYHTERPHQGLGNVVLGGKVPEEGEPAEGRSDRMQDAVGWVAEEQ